MLFGSSYSLIISNTNSKNIFVINDNNQIYNNSIEIRNNDNKFIVYVNNNSNNDINYRLDIDNILGKNIEYTILLNNNYLDENKTNSNYTINQNKVLKSKNIDTYEIKLTKGNITSLVFNIYATNAIDKYANDVIIKLANNNELIKENDNYRYKGINPNNYIVFNNELWRIIGLFKNDNYYNLKIIKDKESDMTSFNNLELNGDFDNSFINTYLNGSYYEKLDDNYRKMIMKYNFNIGNTSSNNFIDSLKNEKKKTYNTYIGLINPSDYLYLQNNNWMKYDNKILLLNKNNEFVNIINNEIEKASSIEELYYIPCLYLRSDVSIIKGVGTILNPYEIKILYPLNI